MENSNVLGRYLRARRAQVSPDELDLPTGGVRRVPGLRREEVASLSGLSVDYYARLEQGRERHPSATALHALARTLRLGPDARRQLFTMAAPGPAVPPRGRRRISRNLLSLADEWIHHPAVLVDESHDVIAANQLGRALYGGHAHSDNLVRLVFLDVDAPAFFRDWTKAAAVAVAGIRTAAAADPGNSRLMALVGELTTRSEEFRRRWARADVRERAADTLLVRHPIVGDLDLLCETLRPNGAPGVLLKVYRAVPGSETAEKLAVLGSLTAPHAEETVPVTE